MCHIRKITDVNNKMKDGSIPFSCFSFRILVTGTLSWLTGTQKNSRAIVDVISNTCASNCLVCCEKKLLNNFLYLIFCPGFFLTAESAGQFRAHLYGWRPAGCSATERNEVKTLVPITGRVEDHCWQDKPSIFNCLKVLCCIFTQRLQTTLSTATKVVMSTTTCAQWRCCRIFLLPVGLHTSTVKCRNWYSVVYRSRSH